MRYEYFNSELEGYQPLWVNADFLHQAEVKNSIMTINDLKFDLLYLDAEYLDIETLEAVYRIARQGLPVCLKTTPLQAGHLKNEKFEKLLEALTLLPNVSKDFVAIQKQKPLIEGENLPEFWCRTDGKSAVIFVANPTAKGLKYPLAYGQSFQSEPTVRQIIINFAGKSSPVELRFEPYQSLLLVVDENGNITFEDITFVPKTPVKSD
jgi:hypothetical protein